MDLAPDITAEDLKVFLEETEEQLQLLDEDIIRLEKEAGNEGLLQGIFRAAHTLKGSSAMLGHSRMSELAHAMESVLDKVRKGELEPRSGVVDALLHSLDGLRALKEELVSSEDSGADIGPMVAELKGVMEEEGGVVSGGGEKEEGRGLMLGEDERERLHESVAAGQRGYLVKVELDRASSFTSVRCFQVVTELSQVGEVIISAPSLKEIEEEKAGFVLELVVTSFQGEEQLKGVVEVVSDVESVNIGAYDVKEVKPAEGGSAGDGGQKLQAQAAQDHGGHAPTSQTVRIDVGLLDKMMNMIGELVISSSRIMQIGKTLESKYKDEGMVQELGRSSTHTSKVVNELHEDIMKVRMLPIGTVFSGFPRMVRDLAQKSKKKVDFIVEGQETGIDRTVVEHIRDPLVHLLRNAVDHGIEGPGERKAAGKLETAVLRLSACHEEGHILITVEDDGKGIDTGVVKEAAVKKGFISAEDAAKMGDDEALDLIFSPGMSTKEKATEVSGRGVGLDIVRKNIEALSGFAMVDTMVGSGTKFRLRLPLTLATLDSLLVSCCEALYAIPIVNVLEAALLKPSEVNTIGGKEVIRLRGSVLPLLRLGRTLGIGDGDMSDEQGAGGNGLIAVVVVRAGDRMVGLAVDALLEKQEIVVKSLGEQMGEIKGISGASILGDGRVALIIDVPTLIDTVTMQALRC